MLFQSTSSVRIKKKTVLKARNIRFRPDFHPPHPPRDTASYTASPFSKACINRLAYWVRVAYFPLSGHPALLCVGAVIELQRDSCSLCTTLFRGMWGWGGGRISEKLAMRREKKIYNISKMQWPNFNDGCPEKGITNTSLKPTVCIMLLLQHLGINRC